jgi:hypothetical protein
MRYRKEEKAALRSASNGTVAGRLRAIATAGLVLGLCAGLQACAGDPTWPSIGKITDLDNIMTPEERQKAVQDIQKDDPNQSGSKTAGK